MVYHTPGKMTSVWLIVLEYITIYREDMSKNKLLFTLKSHEISASHNVFVILPTPNHSGKQEQEVAGAVHHPERWYIEQLRQLPQEAVHPVSVRL